MPRKSTEAGKKIQDALEGLSILQSTAVVTTVLDLFLQFEITYRVGSTYTHIDHLVCGETLKMRGHAWQNIGKIVRVMITHLHQDRARGINVYGPHEEWHIHLRDDRSLNDMFEGGIDGWEKIGGRRPGVFENED